MACPHGAWGKRCGWYPRMVDASRYWMQVSYYRQYYPDDQILVLFFEEFKQDPGSVLRTCFEILDADPDVFIDGVNTGFYSLLAAGFHPDVRVHAFEPVPDIAAMLVENLKLNGFAPEALLSVLTIIDGPMFTLFDGLVGKASAACRGAGCQSCS